MKCKLILSVIIFTSLFLGATMCYAQAPTKQETINWIKQKIQANPGSLTMNCSGNIVDEKCKVSTIINGDDITTTITCTLRKKQLTRAIKFSVNDIVAVGEGDGRTYFDVEVPARKMTTNVEGDDIEHCWIGEDRGVSYIVLFWDGEYDLYKRMKTALKALSDYNKPNESY